MYRHRSFELLTQQVLDMDRRLGGIESGRTPQKTEDNEFKVKTYLARPPICPRCRSVLNGKSKKNKPKSRSRSRKR